jgi:3-oxoacyl-[acyl-carrier-protein] synthase-3
MLTDFRIGFLGSGAHVPETELTNAQLEKLVDTSDEWIRRRTGIHTRRVLDGRESILDITVRAARRALDDAGLAPEDIDDIRVAVSTWMRIPSLATSLQRILGVGASSASDVAAGCAGFVYAVEDASNKMLAEHVLYGRETKALVVGVDTLSEITDWTDRSTCVLLGDGAGAVVLGRVEAGGILATHTNADGRHGRLLYSEPPPADHVHHGIGTPRTEGDGARQFLRMDGRRVFPAAVATMVSDVHRVLEKYQLASGQRIGIEDIDYIFPHQANLRILEMVAKRLGAPLEKVYTGGIAKYGNTSAASIPLGYEDMRHQWNGDVGGRLVVDVAFGAGFASGALLREMPGR